jgi:hypothetical protein
MVDLAAGRAMSNGNWTEKQLAFLREHYPQRGKQFIVSALGRSEPAVRGKASELNLRLNPEGEFFKDFQQRAAQAKVGKKRPDQAEVMRELHRAGKLLKTPAMNAAQSVRFKEWHKNNAHPKGMLGKTHTQATKDRVREGNQRWLATLTDDERFAITKKMMTTKIKNGTLVNPRPNATWKAGWRDIGSVRKYYRSRWEANYARWLEWLLQHGQIVTWSHEPMTFWFEGIKRGCVSYLPDFRVVNNSGEEEFHEVKGWMDARSVTKIKRMAKYHPKVKLIVVDAKQYRAMARQARKMIPDWEGE